MSEHKRERKNDMPDDVHKICRQIAENIVDVTDLNMDWSVEDGLSKLASETEALTNRIAETLTKTSVGKMVELLNQVVKLGEYGQLTHVQARAIVLLHDLRGDKPVEVPDDNT